MSKVVPLNIANNEEQDGPTDKKIESKMRKTILSLQGDLQIGISTKYFIMMVVGMIALPTITTLTAFAAPTCAPWDDNSCHNSEKRFYRWIPVIGVATSLGAVATDQLDRLILMKYFQARLGIFGWVVLLAACASGCITILEILAASWNNVPPFAFPLFIFGGHIFYFLGCICIIYHNYKNLNDAQKVDINWKNICWDLVILNCCNFTSIILLFAYIAFGIGLRKLSYNVIIHFIYSTVGLSCLRESFLVMLQILWDMVDPEEFVTAQLWVFLVHAFMMSILRGGAETWFELVILSAADIVAIFFNLWYISHHKRQHAESIDVESRKYNMGVVEARCATYVILEEFAELIVPTIYLLTLSALYHFPNGQRLAGIRASAFGIDAIGLYGAARSILFILMMEGMSFLIIGVALEKYLQISIRNMSCHLLTQHGPVTLLCLVACPMLCYSTLFVSFGADLTFTFNWL